MPITVFWSWQSDREPKLHHYFVRDALKLALKMLANELEFQESERPEVDHDTRGVAGTPDIASAILAKIAGASVFVADVTPVGKTVPASVRPDLVASKRPKAKYLQNPNVMSELGYADRALGQDSIILVANAAHYPGEQALPFDWRHRRGPVLFRLPSGSATPVINAERQRFAVELRDRLRPMIEAAIAASAAPPPAVERRTSKSDDPAVWEPDGSVLKMRDSFKASIERNVELLEGPRLYARIIPSSWTQKPAQTLLQRLTSDAALYVRGQNGDSGLNPDGAIRVWLAGDYTPQRAVVGTMTQWFRSDGEIWAVDTTSFGKHGEQFAFAYGLPFPRLGLFIHNALQALAGFGAGAPIEVRLGASNLRQSFWPAQFEGDHARALANEVEIVRTSKTWTGEERRRLLFDFFNALAEAYGLQPADKIHDFERVVGIAPLTEAEAKAAALQ